MNSFELKNVHRSAEFLMKWTHQKIQYHIPKVGVQLGILTYIFAANR